MKASRNMKWALATSGLFVILLCTSTYGYEFAGGSGALDDPYQIADVNDLVAIGSGWALLEKHFVLVADLDLDPNLPGMPVFDEAVIETGPNGLYGFMGTFDGNNHTIRHLNVSLFEAVDYGEVRNLRIENADIRAETDDDFWSDGPQVGILAGENQGTIRNCHVTGRVFVNAYFSRKPYEFGDAAGGLVGTNYRTIANCHANVEVTGQENVGGLVGENAGTIIDSHAEGGVTGHRDCRYVGGLVGHNGEGPISGLGTVLRCWATGDVTAGGGSMSVGGLVGDNTRIVALSHASGTVQSGSPLGYSKSGTGGLIGYNTGDVTNCYATGDVSGYKELGGLVGLNNKWDIFEAKGYVGDCYAMGNVVSRSVSEPDDPVYVGGLIGRNGLTRDGLIRDSYFLDPNDGGGPDNGIGTALSRDQMPLQESFVGWDFYGADEDGPGEHWFMLEEGYPVLSWQTETTGLAPVPDVAGMPQDEARSYLGSSGFLAGDVDQTDYDRTIPEGNVLFANPHSYAPVGSAVGLVLSQGAYDWSTNPGLGVAGDSYLVASAGQLEAIGDHPELWDAHFVLTGEIDMAPRSYATALIAPGLGGDAVPFRGHFDGRGHAIRNLAIVTSGVAWRIRNVGLFGSLAPEAEIRGVTLWRASVTPDRGYTPSHVGLLAGTSAGTISDCHVTGEVFAPDGDDVVGGLVGENTSGQLSRCSATVSINAGSNLGGLVGINNGYISCCHAHASLRGNDIVGALAGHNAGTISDCHVTGEVLAPDGADVVGGLVGENANGQLSRCSATVSINAGSNLGGLVGINNGFVSCCYAHASVHGYDIVGALAGHNMGAIENCYAGGSVSVMGNNCVGALVGTNSASGGGRARSLVIRAMVSGGRIANCYTTASIEWQFFPSSCLVGCNYSDDVVQSVFLINEEQDPNHGPGTPLTRPQMQDTANFAGWDFYGNDEDGNTDPWFMPDEGEPILTWQTEATGLRAMPDLSGLTVEQARQKIEALGLTFGDIVGHDYFSVPEGCVGLALGESGAAYVPLGGAIDVILSLGPYDWETLNAGDGSATAPYEIETPGQLESLIDHPELYSAHLALAGDIDLLGRAYSQALFPPHDQAFSGSFDGRGHTIRNLTIRTPENAEPLGLFSAIGEDARVVDLGLENTRITGGNLTGAVVGQNYGTVAKCFSSGTVRGLDVVGGLVGENAGNVIDCYVTGSVGGRNRIGGLIGGNAITPSRGPDVPGSVRNCYTLASVSAEQVFGALVGHPDCGDIVNSYYRLPQDPEIIDSEFCEGLTESQMKDQQSFLDWDFENVWMIYEGADSPRLRWENHAYPGEN